MRLHISITRKKAIISTIVSSQKLELVLVISITVINSNKEVVEVLYIYYPVQF